MDCCLCLLHQGCQYSGPLVPKMEKRPGWSGVSNTKDLGFFHKRHSLIMHRQKPKVLGKSSSNCKGSLYTFVPAKTRRGKDTYKEEDARKLYSMQSETSTPTTSGTSVTQNATFSGFSEADNLPTSDWMDEQPAYRRTKVCTSFI